MARIGFSLSGIERSLLNRLAEDNAVITLSSLRLATGKKINAPSDDPSGFAFLSGLQSQLGNVTAAMSNVTAAGSLVSQTQIAVGQIQTQLATIRTELLKDENHTLTAAQRAESQAKIDTAIEQIHTVAGGTTGGRRMLDGSADYTYSGRNSSQVSDVAVYAAQGPTATISGTVISTAIRAELVHTGNALNKIDADGTFTLAGNRGQVVVEVHAGDLLADVATEVNNNSHKTGITAAVNTGTHKLTFTTVDYGSSATIAVTVDAGAFPIDGGVATAAGADASAVINGQTIAGNSSSVDGNRFTLNDNGLRFSIEFKAGFTGNFDTITVGGDPPSFALSTDLGRRSTLAVPGVQPERLGGPSGTLDQLCTGGSLAGLGDHTSQAIRVVDEAADRVTRVKGSVDGFYNAAITSSSGLLSALQTTLGDAIDAVDEVDPVEEAQIQLHYESLASNAVAGLTILNQQRQSIVQMIRVIAGLA